MQTASSVPWGPCRTLVTRHSGRVPARAPEGLGVTCLTKGLGLGLLNLTSELGPELGHAALLPAASRYRMGDQLSGRSQCLLALSQQISRVMAGF